MLYWQARMEARSAKRRRQVDQLYELWDVNASGYLEVEEIHVVLNKWRSDGIDNFKEGASCQFIFNWLKLRNLIVDTGQVLNWPRPASDFSFCSMKRLGIIATPFPLGWDVSPPQNAIPLQSPTLCLLLSYLSPSIFPAFPIKFQIPVLRPIAINCRGLCSNVSILKGC